MLNFQKNTYIYLLAVCLCPSKKRLFWSVFKIRLFSCYLHFETLYNISINLSTDIRFANIFSHPTGCLCTLLITPCAVQKLFEVPSFVSFASVAWTFRVMSNESFFFFFGLDQFQDDFSGLVFKISPVSSLMFKTFLLSVDFKNLIRAQYLIPFFCTRISYFSRAVHLGDYPFPVIFAKDELTLSLFLGCLYFPLFFF